MPTLFEIHLTTEALTQAELPDFIAFCKSIAAKPILIELPAGQQRQQPMISKVFTLNNPQEIHRELNILRRAFIQSDYPVVREKVEVPLEFEAAGKSAFPDYYGGYYEWHGKVEVQDPDQLLPLLMYPKAHLSRNSIRGEQQVRFVTFRTTQHVSHFRQWTAQLEHKVKAGGFRLLKTEAEYCCYDSNKEVDRGWSDIPEITDRNYLNLLGYEGFLRRAARITGPFMLKGSMVSRQFLPLSKLRLPGDLDFVYLKRIQSPTAAARLFSTWVSEVTESVMDDEISFRSFRENDFWRRIDYAMDDDFPTTNTDLLFYLPDGSSHEISLDISWNLPVPEPPVPIIYQPTTPGEEFILDLTVPLSLQVAWKLHQTIVRVRTKDIVDLIFLAAHADFTPDCRVRALQALSQECKKDGVSPSALIPYLDGSIIDQLEATVQSYNNEEFIFWRLKGAAHSPILSRYHLQWTFPDLLNHWQDVPELLLDFAKILYQAGITEKELRQL